MKDIRQTFKEKIFECNKHAQKIEVAQKHLSNFIPLSVQSYQNASSSPVSVAPAWECIPMVKASLYSLYLFNIYHSSLSS